MADREESRKEWERELIDVQHSVTFDQELRCAEIITKKLSATPAPIPDFAHLLMLLFSGAFLVATFLLFSTDIRHKTLLGLVALSVSICFAIAAFRRSRNRR
jgi:hypothetical protein